MFNLQSNAPFNTIACHSWKIDDMHESMERLYLAAKTLRGVSGQSAVARALNASPQTVKNWEKRGVSTPGLIAAESAFGCSPVWVKSGDGSMTSSQDVRTSAQSDNERERFTAFYLELSPEIRAAFLFDLAIVAMKKPPSGGFFSPSKKSKHGV